MSHTDEYELIVHSHVADCTMFIVDLFYRPIHLHKEMELILVLEGNGDVTTEGKIFSVRAGDILIFESGELHEINGGEKGLRLLAIQISRSFCKRYCPQLRSLRFSRCFISCTGDKEKCLILGKTMKQALCAYLDQSLTGTFRCMSCVNVIFEKLLQLVDYEILDQAQLVEQTKRKDRIRRILMYLGDHYREPVRLSDLSKMENITETHLSHFFRDHLHITFQDYLSRLRVEAAMNMLRTTALSLTNISYECGFSDPKYLNQNFKKILGISPAQWRTSGVDFDILQYQTKSYAMQHIFSKEEMRCWMEENASFFR